MKTSRKLFYLSIHFEPPLCMDTAVPERRQPGGTECLKRYLSQMYNCQHHVTVCHFLQGEEIFNTFGKLGNSHLLHMYGFVEKLPNPNDTVSTLTT